MHLTINVFDNATVIINNGEDWDYDDPDPGEEIPEEEEEKILELVSKQASAG